MLPEAMRSISLAVWVKKKHLVNFWTKIRSERLNDFHETYLGFRFLIMIEVSYYRDILGGL